MTPLIYIILVNYNGADDTIECIKSLEKINYKNFKVLIVDNCSNDDSVKILENNIGNDYRIIKSKYNNGFSSGNNIGIEIAISEGADYVLLLNNDTIVEKNFLNELLNAIDENTGIAIGKIYYANNRNMLWYDGGELNNITGKVSHTNFDKVDKVYNKEIKEVTFATGCCMLIPKKVIQKVGVLSEEYFLYYEDLDYCYRVRSNGFNILYNPRSIIYHNVSSSTGKNSKLSQYYMTRNKLIFIKVNFKFFNRLSAYVFFILELIIWINRGYIESSIARRAIKDFKMNIWGKSF